MFYIIPAIDLVGGEAVRLYKGDHTRKTVYSKNPVELAQTFEKMGAKYLHIVDLDGAKAGNTANIETIRKIRTGINIPIQIGGGIRTAETVALYLEDIKVDRVILGTIAVAKTSFVREMVAKYGAERIVVGVDALEGKVRTAGWVDNSGLEYLGFIEKMIQIGVEYIVLTDISKDGTLTSPNWSMYEKVSGVNIIVAGGVSCDADIEKARKHYGVIVGKAYYEGKVDLEKCIRG